MFKVKCKLVAFVGHEEKFPCHFGYKIGDEFYYDGVEFKGRICPGLLASMMPVVHGTFLLGYKYNENVMFRYRGLDIKAQWCPRGRGLPGIHVGLFFGRLSDCCLITVYSCKIIIL